jgi:hypothetical protein
MNEKETKIQETIEQYLYTRDDVLDLNAVEAIAEEITKRLKGIV